MPSKHVLLRPRRGSCAEKGSDPLGCLPVVGVGDLRASAAFPDGFTLSLQRLEVIREFEPIVLAGRIQENREDFLWLQVVSRLVSNPGNRRFFGPNPDAVWL